MLLLLLSLVALALGPLLHVVGTRHRGVREGLDGFVFVSIAGLVFFHVIPEVMETTGSWAIGFAAIGLFGPLIFERYIKKLASEAHALALILGMAGTVLHGMIDGMALSSSTGFGALGLAVLVHRLPVGLAVWWLLKPQKGLKAAVAVLSAIGLATIVGYGVAEGAAAHINSFPAQCFQALVAGSLLHVVFHLSHRMKPIAGGIAKHAPGIGGAVALAALLFLNPEHEHGHEEGGAHPGDAAAHVESFAETFFELVAISAPALLIAYIMAGLISAFLPLSSTRWMQRGGPLTQATKGVAFGLPLPVCSCGVVPLYKSLIEKRVPLPAAVAFLIATPELGLDAVILSLPLLGGPMTLARVAAAGLLAVFVGWYLGKRFPDQKSADPAPEKSDDEPSPLTLVARLKQALGQDTMKIVDTTGPWILLGLVVAAGLEPLLEGQLMEGFPAALEVPFFALLGIPLYVCATGATPMVAVLLLSGVSPGAALAFLLTGPATNVTTFGLLGRLHGKSMATTFALVMLAATIGLGYLLNTLDLPVAGLAAESDHEHGARTTWEVATTWLFFSLLIISLIRQGPRLFAARVLSWTNSEGESPDEPTEGDGSKAKSPCCGG